MLVMIEKNCLPAWNGLKTVRKGDEVIWDGGGGGSGRVVQILDSTPYQPRRARVKLNGTEKTIDVSRKHGLRLKGEL